MKITIDSPTDQEVFDALSKAIRYAIDTVGWEEFRKCSFFPSSRKASVKPTIDK